MCAHWFNLGLQLEVSVIMLHGIKGQFLDPRDQLLEMLKFWLITSDKPSWKTLTDALRSQIVGESHLASVLERKYMKDTLEGKH